MSLASFEALIRKYPRERSTIERLAAYFGGEDYHELTFEHLAARTQPRSPEVLAILLAELTQAGAVRRVFRVESRGHGGIADFASLDDVPPRIHDWLTDQDVDVTPADCA
jgi:hypothetical protein